MLHWVARDIIFILRSRPGLPEPIDATDVAICFWRWPRHDAIKRVLYARDSRVEASTDHHTPDQPPHLRAIMAGPGRARACHASIPARLLRARGVKLCGRGAEAARHDSRQVTPRTRRHDLGTSTCAAQLLSRCQLLPSACQRSRSASDVIAYAGARVRHCI